MKKTQALSYIRSGIILYVISVLLNFQSFARCVISRGVGDMLMLGDHTYLTMPGDFTGI